MSNVIKLVDQGEIYDEAGEWVGKFDKGLDAHQKHEFQKWLCSDQSHYDAFMSMASSFDAMDELSRLSDLFPEESMSPRPRSFWARGIGIAASTVLFTVLAIFLVESSFLKVDAITNHYETSVGESSTVVLPDSSVMVLNTNSLVTVDYSDTHRLITLERGEINIDVAHDESRPLSVKAADKVVQAVGTAFNIQLLKDREFELIVTHGKVRVGERIPFEAKLAQIQSPIQKDGKNGLKRAVRISEESLSVSKGEKLIVGVVAQLQPVKLEEKEIERDLSWRQGNIIFEGQPLGDAIKEITRYTQVEFEFENEEMKEIRIAGIFRAGDVNGLLLALDAAFDISSTKISKERISLSHKIENL